jgi:hypothetical protein
LTLYADPPGVGGAHTTAQAATTVRGAAARGRSQGRPFLRECVAMDPWRDAKTNHLG